MAVRKKVSKASVHYRPAMGAKHCGNCAMYHKGTCDLVLGKVSPMDVCDKWVKK